MSVTVEMKRNAVGAALSSKVFSRAHRLRAVLQYVCAEEIDGKGRIITPQGRDERCEARERPGHRHHQGLQGGAL